MKTTSRLAMVAAAGIMMGGFTLSAKAADLGGDCCADLEERVAELEATTARKGNRKVSLEVSGQVNRALMVWDDGVENDAYVADNDASSTRFRFKGSAQMKPGWTAGFLLEIQIEDDSSSRVDQDNDDSDWGDESGINLRHANWYIESERYGRVTVGQGSPATKDITLINLGGSISDSDNYFANSFFLRGDNEFASGLSWGDLAPGSSGSRLDVIRYDTPSIYGFILSAAWGEDDYADVALRYQKEWNSIRFAAGVGYRWDGDDNDKWDGSEASDEESILGSASIMHVPSGIYLSIAGGQTEYGERQWNGEDSEGQFYYAQLGITKRFNSYGATTLYAEYGRFEDYAQGLTDDLDQGGAADDLVTSSEVNRYGFGVVQAFDSAALELYAQFHYYEGELSGEENGPGGDKVSYDAEDFAVGVFGARIKF